MKIPWKRQPLYRILCYYLLNMCYEKNEKQMRKIGEILFRKIGKKNETRKQKKTI